MRQNSELSSVPMDAGDKSDVTLWSQTALQLKSSALKLWLVPSEEVFH